MEAMAKPEMGDVNALQDKWRDAGAAGAGRGAGKSLGLVNDDQTLWSCSTIHDPF